MVNLIGIYSSLPGMGKTTVANYLVENYGYTKVSFAWPIKAMALELLMSMGMLEEEAYTYLEDIDKKNKAVIPGLGATMREVLQTLGTDWGRTLNPDIWTNVAMLRCDNIAGPVVIDDMRFPNESIAIQEKGGIVIRVIRSEVEDHSNNHASEGQLDNSYFHYELHNNGSFENLYGQIHYMMVLQEAKNESFSS